MLSLRSICSVWAVLLLTHDAFSISVHDICARRCLYGRGGILCHCNAMHFTGKRSGPQTRNQPSIWTKGYSDSLLHKNIQNVLLDYKHLADLADSEDFLDKISDVSSDIMNDDNDGVKHDRLFHQSGSGNEPAVAMVTKRPQSSLRNLKRILNVKWSDRDMEQSIQSKGHDVGSSRNNFGHAVGAQDKDKTASGVGSDERIAGIDGKDDGADQEVARVIEDMINRLEMLNHRPARSIVRDGSDTDTVLIGNGDDDIENDPYDEKSKGVDDGGDEFAGENGSHAARVPGGVISIGGLDKQRAEMEKISNGGSRRRMRVFLPRGIRKRHPTLTRLLRQRE